ncbi:MAG: hypothetical protein GTO41_02040 [Burkholderiales bacterium]|nr:hypothetical protein [Burkholderiales bacterium]
MKESLPLLSRRAWYKKTKYGYARGVESVRFVGRVRTYYDVLVKIDEEENPTAETDVFKIQAPAL